jgi:hypothetical protein
LNSTVSCGTMPMAARRLSLRDRAQVLRRRCVIAPAGDVVEAEQQPRQRGLARAAGGPTTATVLPARTSKLTSCRIGRFGS